MSTYHRSFIKLYHELNHLFSIMENSNANCNSILLYSELENIVESSFK